MGINRWSDIEERKRNETGTPRRATRSPRRTKGTPPPDFRPPKGPQGTRRSARSSRSLRSEGPNAESSFYPAHRTLVRRTLDRTQREGKASVTEDQYARQDPTQQYH